MLHTGRRPPSLTHSTDAAIASAAAVIAVAQILLLLISRISAKFSIMSKTRRREAVLETTALAAAASLSAAMFAIHAENNLTRTVEMVWVATNTIAACILGLRGMHGLVMVCVRALVEMTPEAEFAKLRPRQKVHRTLTELQEYFSENQPMGARIADVMQIIASGDNRYPDSVYDLTHLRGLPRSPTDETSVTFLGDTDVSQSPTLPSLTLCFMCI